MFTPNQHSPDPENPHDAALPARPDCDILHNCACLDDGLAAVLQHFQADSGTVHFLEADGLLHLAAHGPGMPPAVLNLIQVIPPGKGIAGQALLQQGPITECNIQTNQSGVARPGAKATLLKGAIAVPIWAQGAVIGVLGIGTYRERSFPPDEVARLTQAAEGLAGLPL